MIAAFLLFFFYFRSDEFKQGVADVTECNVLRRTTKTLNKKKENCLCCEHFMPYASVITHLFCFSLKKISGIFIQTPFVTMNSLFMRVNL